MRVFTTFIVLAFSAGSFRTAVGEDVTWLKMDNPPAFVTPGPGRDNALVGHGYGDEITRWVAQALATINHKELIVSNARRDNLLRGASETYCFATTQYSEDRAKYLYFSGGGYRVPTARVIVKSVNANRFEPFLDARREIDLQRLLEAHGLAGAVERDRVHSPEIDRVLALAPRLWRAPSVGNLVNMLMVGRMEWMVGRVPEAYFATGTGGINDAPVNEAWFTSFPIAGSQAFTEGHVACAKTPTGRLVTDRVDLLVQSFPDHSLQRFADPWLDAASRALIHGGADAEGLAQR